MNKTTMAIPELLGQLGWRYATKIFEPGRPFTDEQLDGIAEILRLTPSSFGMQPWKFLLITDAEIRVKLRKASWNQAQVTDSSVYVVLCRLERPDAAFVDHFVDQVATSRNQARTGLQGYRDMMVNFVQKMNDTQAGDWAADQVYIALGNLMTSCAVLGYDTCPLEGFDKAQYDAILGLPDLGLRSVVACAVGYRGDGDKYASIAKVRFPASEVVLRR